MGNKRHFVFDSALEMKDAGLVAADAAAQVDSAAKIVDLGESRMDGTLIVDVTAIEIASNDERYDICFQVSDSASFASGIVEVAVLSLGAHEVLSGDTDSTTGRYELKVHNEVNGTIYRYARVYTDVTGTIATGINFSAYLSLG